MCASARRYQARQSAWRGESAEDFQTTLEIRDRDTGEEIFFFDALGQDVDSWLAQNNWLRKEAWVLDPDTWVADIDWVDEDQPSQQYTGPPWGQEA